MISAKQYKNNILDYKEPGNSIHIDEEVAFISNTDQWHCTNSIFCSPHHKHIITWDHKIIKSNKLKKKIIEKGAY